jgi:hypothetical protein
MLDHHADQLARFRGVGAVDQWQRSERRADRLGHCDYLGRLVGLAIGSLRGRDLPVLDKLPGSRRWGEYHRAGLRAEVRTLVVAPELGVHAESHVGANVGQRC